MKYKVGQILQFDFLINDDTPYAVIKKIESDRVVIVEKYGDSILYINECDLFYSVITQIFCEE